MDGLRTEHTIGSFIAPHDAETASLTDPQIGQIFWNMAMTEAMVLAMLFDSEGDGPVRPIQVIILATISAGGETSARHCFRENCAARVRRSRASYQRWWRAGTAFRGSLRRKFSWAFNFFVFFMMCWMVITYALQFGEEKTQDWLLGWVVSSAHAWLIIEPLEVIILALFPVLLENECVANARETAKELGLY